MNTDNLTADIEALVGADEPNDSLFQDFSIPLDGEVEEPKEKFQIGYRHKRIAHFKVGQFVFHDHILRIVAHSPEELASLNEEFVRLYHGLMQIDRVNIVRLRELSNEVSISESRAVRGSLGSDKVSDKPINGESTGIKSGFKFRASLPQQSGGA